LSQPILDRLKLVLPPKSVVSKSIATGEYNFELQKLTRQMMKYCLSQMNTQGKKNDKKFQVYSTAYFSLNAEHLQLSNFLSNSRIDFLIADVFIKKLLSHSEREYKATLQYKLDTPSQLNLYGVQSTTDNDSRWIKINNEIAHHGQFTLKKGDEISFSWTI
jgi:predicted enzyme involved in methoxymalonyl-ACP biosynthesis